MDRAQRHLTQAEAAALCGCDYSTVRRRRERGLFPGARQRDDVTGCGDPAVRPSSPPGCGDRLTTTTARTWPTRWGGPSRRADWSRCAWNSSGRMLTTRRWRPRWPSAGTRSPICAGLSTPPLLGARSGGEPEAQGDAVGAWRGAGGSASAASTPACPRPAAPAAASRRALPLKPTATPGWPRRSPRWRTAGRRRHRRAFRTHP